MNQCMKKEQKDQGGMASAVAMIKNLCSVRFRRRSAPKAIKIPSQEGLLENLDLSSSLSQQTTEAGGPKENEESQFKELPLPPGKQFRDSGTAVDDSGGSGMKKSASTRNLNITKAISARLPRSLSQVAGRDREKKATLKHEDSIWKKTIILGEKCRVPDQDEDEAILFDENGRKIPTYYPKTTTPRPLGSNNASPSHDVGGGVASSGKEKEEHC